jgi:hypothetical protein
VLSAVLLDDEGKKAFEPVVDEDTLLISDVCVGLYDDEEEAACGILCAMTQPEEEDNVSFSIMGLIISDSYKDQGGDRILIRYLQDIAWDFGCTTISYTGQVSGEKDDVAGTLMDMGFYEEEEKLSLYGFSLSDIGIINPEPDLLCKTLSEISPEQWQEFEDETGDYDFVLDDIDDYEKSMSVLLINDDSHPEAGILFKNRGEVIFAEAMAAYGLDEEALINDVFLWSTDRGKKLFGKEKQVELYLPKSKSYHDILMRLTGNKAKRVGSLNTYTYEVPVKK